MPQTGAWLPTGRRTQDLSESEGGGRPAPPRSICFRVHCFEGWCTHVMHGHSRMTVDPRIPTMPGRNTSGFSRPGRHRLHRARSAVRYWAIRMKGEPHPTLSMCCFLGKVFVGIVVVCCCCCCCLRGGRELLLSLKLACCYYFNLMLSTHTHKH